MSPVQVLPAHGSGTKNPGGAKKPGGPKKDGGLKAPIV
jgi:hypothetical protein